MDYLPYTETPLQELVHPLTEQQGIRLLIKREDLNHPSVSGNKWWKLKYNLIDAKEKGSPTILTFGGAFSNHIYATSAACCTLGLKSVGIIRGERIEPLNPTLAFAENNGMRLEFISRQRYRLRDDESFLTDLGKFHGDFYLIPEGGTNSHAIKGCVEFAKKLESINFDHAFLAVGTGGTMAGVLAGINGQKKISGVSVLKGGEFLRDEISKLVSRQDSIPHSNFSLLTEYHFGGYGKVTPELVAFIREMKQHYDLPLDPVYTGKMLRAIFSEIQKGNIPRGTTILAIHTGGLQGSSVIMNNFE